MKIIKGVSVEEIVIVTNGYWASTLKNTKNILDKIYNIQKGSNKKITIRVSVDKWHCETLGSEYLKNIIDIFKAHYKGNKAFKLKIHTIIGDKTIYNLLRKYHYNYEVTCRKGYTSDSKVLNKKNKSRISIRIENNFDVEVECAKLFYPNIEVDLNSDTIKQEKVFMNDLSKEQQGNFSIAVNEDGTIGTDFLINYNGNISSWCNYQTFNSPNIYVDNYNTIIEKIYTDIISYSFLKEPFYDIMNTIKEVNENAVRRAISINIRDYFGMYLLHENKTLLYYYIVMIKKYLQEGKITNFQSVPNEIKQIISCDLNKVIELYKKADYDIIDQYMEKAFDENIWQDLFYMISLRHYDVSEDKIKHALNYYNLKTNNKYTDYREVYIKNDNGRYSRLLKRFNI